MSLWDNEVPMGQRCPYGAEASLWGAVLSVGRCRPDLVDMEALRRCNAHYNLQSAFNVAERELGLTRLLDPEGEGARGSGGGKWRGWGGSPGVLGGDFGGGPGVLGGS